MPTSSDSSTGASPVRRTPSARPKRPTLRMVADEAGVSIATVSYVLAGRVGRAGRGPGVRDETIKRVRQAAEHLDYHPNQAARTMRTGRTDTVLLSLTMLSDPWSQGVAEATAAALRDDGITPLILADGDWSRVVERQATDATFVDGVVDDPETRARLAALAARGERLIVFSETMPADGFDVIRSVDLGGVQLASRYLLENYESVGVVAGGRSDETAEGHRFRILSATADELGRPIAAHHIVAHQRTSTSAYEAALRLLDRPDRPHAVLAVSDYVAIATVNAALRLGLRVPTDVAVMGVGNTPEAELMNPTLSSVGPDDFFERLATIIAGRATGSDTSDPTVHNFPWRLQLRGSTR